MNVNRLHAAAAPQVQRVVKDAEEKEADFLALRMLNKQTRVRLSPSSHNLDPLPGKGVLFATANSLGCFAAATRDTDGQHRVIVSGLAELRTAFATKSDTEIPFSPRRTISLPAQPSLLCFSASDSRLVVCLISGSIAVYDASVAATPGTASLEPLHVFSSPTGRPPHDLVTNPGDMPDLVAVLYEPPASSDSSVVELLDTRGLQVIGGWQSGGTPETTPASICWSPKGKQVAIGLQSGDIVTFSPNDTSSVKTMIPRPTSVESHGVISTSWLSNPDFHCVYASAPALAPDGDQVHRLISLDSKAATVSEIRLAPPCLPFPGLRPSGPFTVVFRHWEPTKFLIFTGDSASSDIGLMGCMETNGKEDWINFTLEENSTPTLPLDQEMNDTVLLGLALDLTATETYTHKTVSGEDSVLPPPPVMYAYASDGTVIGWNILHIHGKPYPGMKSAVAAPAPIQQIASVNMESADMDEKSEPEPAPVTGTPQSQPQPQPTPAFGQSAFGQASFGSSTPDASTFSKATGSSGFGAFASAGPSKFGQPSSLGVNPLAPSSSGSALPSPMAVSTSTMSTAEETMSTDTPTEPSFGGLSLGGNAGNDPDKPKPTGATGMFGAFGNTPTPDSSASTSAFGSTSSMGSVLKPAAGFGAFGGQATSSFGFGNASPNPSSAVNAAAAPSPAFGSTGFGAAKTASPAFGQSTGFGASPAFGQSGFGQSSFGTATPTKSAFGSGGGFAAFAQGGATSFGSASKASPAPSGDTTPKTENGSKSQDEEKKAESTAPSTSVFATPSTPPAKAASAFGSPNPFSTPGAPTTPTKTPPTTGGAFGNLTASPSGFGKLDSGFGAFGSTTPSSSPFFNPPKTPGAGAFGSSTPSALASVASSPGTPTPAAKPTFGAPSAFGKTVGGPSTPESKSVFGSSSSLGSSPSSPGAFSNLGSNSASAKGFSNFSGGGGFGAFAKGGQKSFGDLLRTETDNKDKESATPKAPVSVFSQPPAPSNDAGEGSSKPQRTSVFAIPLKKPGEVKDEDKDKEVSTRNQDDDEQEEEDEDDHHDDDDTGSFISETFSDEESLPDEHDNEEEEEEEEEEDEDALLEAQLASGLSAIPSAPTIHLTDSSPPESPEKGKAPALAEDTSTPIESSDKQPPVAAPVPINAAASTQLNVGLGRPSTKPTRSSPLASAPISGGDSEDDTTEKLSQAKVAEASKPSTSKSPSPAVKTEEKETSVSRTKTPPLTSIFGPSPPVPKPLPFTLTPSSSTPASSIFGAPLTTSSITKTNDSNAQTTTQKMPSVFSPPVASTPATKQPEPASSTISLFPPTGAKSTAPPTPSIFGSIPKPAPVSFPPPPTGSLFGQKPPTPPSVPTPGALPTGGVFGAKSGASTPALPTGGLFGQKPPSTSSLAPPAAGQTLFGKAPVASAPPANAAAPTMDATVRPTDNVDPLADMPDGIAKECLHLLVTMARELELLKREAMDMSKRRAQHYQSKAIVRSTKDLADPTKFGVGDVQEFSRLLQALENDVEDLKGLRAGYSKALRELDTAMLKATMRKEEIVRFSKANSDAEFAKMLKARTLGPEHLETQTQLRRGIRVLRDRIQKLEDHLDSSKKRLNQLKMGKAGVKAPTLDTINRTYRNIDLAVTQQADDVARLAARLNGLDLKSAQADRLALDFTSSPAKEITDSNPDIAATTAAALNAERAAQKLKRALLKARKEPLLNKRAATAPIPPSSFVSTQKATQSQDTPTKEFKLSSSLWNSAAPVTPGQPKTPSWGASSFHDTESPSSSPSPSHRHGSFNRESKHAKPIPLKKSPGAASTVASSPPPPGFSWGPLPGVTPMATLSSDVRKKEEGSKLPFSLSSSWVTEGFDAKK